MSARPFLPAAMVTAGLALLVVDGQLHPEPGVLWGVSLVLLLAAPLVGTGRRHG